MIRIEKLRRFIWLAIAIWITSMPALVVADGIDFSQYRDDDRPDKIGVLVIALIPRDVSTATKQELMDQRIKTAFPGIPVRWSYFDIGSGQTEAFKTTGQRVPPRRMLNQMEEEGITHLAILPLAVIPGETYTRLVWMVDTLRKMPTKFRRIALARPFFGAPGDIAQTCQTVLNLLPGHSDTGEAVVLFFEEQSRLGDYIYPGIQYYFWQLDESVFIGTAGTTPGMQDVFRALKKANAADVYLVPFLPYQTPALTAWKTTLEERGYRVSKINEPVIGQKKAMDVMITRFKGAVNELGRGEK